MVKNNELRTETQQNLSPSAQQIEAAKALIEAMRGSDLKTIENALKKQYPDLDEKKLKDLLG